MQPEKRLQLFVTGTDTDVGKTLFGAALLRAWRRLGLQAVGLKPVATGSRDDALRLREASGSEIPLEKINPFFFRCPAAPALAAKEEGCQLDLLDVEARIVPLLKVFSPAIVEGVGGWLTPLTPTKTVRDLALRLRLPVVIVALCRLGVMNHALLTVESVRAAGLTPAGMLLNGFPEPSDRVRVQTARWLERQAELPVADFREAEELVRQPPSWLLPD